MATRNDETRQRIAAIYQHESRRVLATLIRLLHDFELAEEALQEAFTAALAQWPDAGIPGNPRAWLVSAGRFKAIDRVRRRVRFDASVKALAQQLEIESETALEEDEQELEDDQLRLIFTCCHPALSAEARIALTLREVCGLTTEAIARAFLLPTPTVAQRIVRAKGKIRDAGIPYQVPGTAELPERLDSVLRVVYLVFNEGYSSLPAENAASAPNGRVDGDFSSGVLRSVDAASSASGTAADATSDAEDFSPSAEGSSSSAEGSSLSAEGSSLSAEGSSSSAEGYLWNEGSCSGEDESRPRGEARQPLCDDAIRLGRLLHNLLPLPEVTGLLALMLLQSSRRHARTTAAGELILLADQDRSRWDRAQIAEGCALIEAALATGRAGPYALQAAIAAVHAEAPTAAATDWAQIAGLYDVLLRHEPSPVVALNRAVAVAMRDGPRAGLELIEPLLNAAPLNDYFLAHAARADLCRRLGRIDEARAAYRQAVTLTQPGAERQFLEKRLAELAG